MEAWKAAKQEQTLEGERLAALKEELRVAEEFAEQYVKKKILDSLDPVVVALRKSRTLALSLEEKPVEKEQVTPPEAPLPRCRSGSSSFVRDQPPAAT